MRTSHLPGNSLVTKARSLDVSSVQYELFCLVVPSIGNSIKQRILRFLDVLFLLETSDVLPGQHAYMERCLGELSLLNNRIKGVDEGVQEEPLTTLSPLPAYSKPDLAPAQRLK